MEAVKQEILAIKYIENPCEEVKTIVYGEVTKIIKNDDICRKCKKENCKLFENEIIKSKFFFLRKIFTKNKCFIRSKCEYLIEHASLEI